jgi:LysM repeat protein
MAARNPARYLAPVALAAVVAGGYLIVHHNLSENSHSSTTSSSLSQTSGSSHSKHHRDGHAKYARVTFYTVKPGETLTAISQLTGVSLATIESLNPRLNPQALQAGQRIRLRR